MKRLEVLMNTKDKSGKTRYTKVGSAFVRDDGSISISIDPGVSISTPEGTWCNLKEPLPPRGQQGSSQGGGEDPPF